MRFTRIVALAAIALCGPAHSSDLKQIDIVDFLVDWPDYIGSRVIVTGGFVTQAGTESTVLHSNAGLVFLRPPWPDREGLRFVLHECTGLVPRERCAMAVSGTVGNGTMGSPELTVPISHGDAMTHNQPTYEIEKGVEIPKPWRAPRIYPFDKLGPGDSFFVPDATHRNSS
jgi:hypothetical protein